MLRWCFSNLVMLNLPASPSSIWRRKPPLKKLKGGVRGKAVIGLKCNSCLLHLLRVRNNRKDKWSRNHSHGLPVRGLGSKHLEEHVQNLSNPSPAGFLWPKNLCIFHAKCSTASLQEQVQREPPLLQGTPLPRIHIQVLTAAFLFILSITNKWEMHKPQLVVCWGQNIVLIITSWPRERRKEIRKKREGRKEGRQRERKEEGRKGEKRRGEGTGGGRQGAHSMTRTYRCAPAYASTHGQRLPRLTHTRTCSLITAAHSRAGF